MLFAEADTTFATSAILLLLLVTLLIVLAIRATLLRMACALHNAFVNQKKRRRMVPEPTFAHAFWILAVFLFNCFGLGLLLGIGLVVTGTKLDTLRTVPSFWHLSCIAFLVYVFTLRVTLPTTWIRALKVSLINELINLALTVPLVLFFVWVGLEMQKPQPAPSPNMVAPDTLRMIDNMESVQRRITALKANPSPPPVLPERPQQPATRPPPNRR